MNGVAVDSRLYARLVNAAGEWARRAHPDGGGSPVELLDAWVTSLENARTQPTPSAEPGDLLVKLARSEFWSFTARGHWIELAPVYRMGDPLAAARQTLDDARHERREHERAWTEAAGKAADPGFSGGMRDRPVPGFTREASDHGEHGGVSGAQKRVAGVDPAMVEAASAAGPPFGDTRFWGKGVVEQELDRRRDLERLWPPIKKCLDELLELHHSIEVVTETVAFTDLGDDAARTLVGFRDGVETARKLLLDTATRELGGYTVQADDD